MHTGKKISVKPLSPNTMDAESSQCCCRKSSDTVTGLHTEKAENTKTTSNFHPPTPLLISKLKSHSEPSFTESQDNVGFSFLPLQYESLIECHSGEESFSPTKLVIELYSFSHSVPQKRIFVTHPYLETWNREALLQPSSG